MRKHIFLEYKAGRFNIVKQFLHFTGYDENVVDDSHKDNDCLCEIHTLTILTKEGNAKCLARNFAKSLNLKCVEGYNLKSRDLKYGDVLNISTVSDIDKTNRGINMLSNWIYAFVYPQKYQNYDIYRLDYIISYKDKYLKKVDYSIDEKRDEIIFSLNDRVRHQIICN